MNNDNKRITKRQVRSIPCELRTNGKRWTTEEIVDECKEVIDQIVNKYADEATKNE